MYIVAFIWFFNWNSFPLRNFTFLYDGLWITYFFMLFINLSTMLAIMKRVFEAYDIKMRLCIKSIRVCNKLRIIILFFKKIRFLMKSFIIFLTLIINNSITWIGVIFSIFMLYLFLLTTNLLSYLSFLIFVNANFINYLTHLL